MGTECYAFRLTADDVKYELVNLRQLVFEVTDACNLRCRYCIFGEFYSGFDQRSYQYLPFEEAKAVIDYLADLWRNNANAAARAPLTVSFYGGEPLMNFPLIRQIVDYVRSLQIPKSVGFMMTSNCVLLDRYADYLVENDFHLLCSLDGDRHSDAYRIFQDGSPSFDRVFTNIKLVQTKYPVFFAENVYFNAVLHNLNDVPGLLSFFRREFDKVPMISELNSVGVREDQKSAFIKTFRNMREDIYHADNREEIMKEMRFDAPETRGVLEYLSTSTGNVFDTYSGLLSLEEDTPRAHTAGTCIPFSRKLFVKVDGKIMPCERIHHSFSPGFVRGGKVELDPQAVADWFNAFLDKLNPRCRSCASLNSCKKCLYTIDGIETKHFVCDAFITQSQLRQKDAYYQRYLYSHPTLYREFMKDTIID